MIDVSELGKCCYDCGYVDIDTDKYTFFGTEVEAYQNYVKIFCKHGCVCGRLLKEQEALDHETV